MPVSGGDRNPGSGIGAWNFNWTENISLVSVVYGQTALTKLVASPAKEFAVIDGAGVIFSGGDAGDLGVANKRDSQRNVTGEDFSIVLKKDAELSSVIGAPAPGGVIGTNEAAVATAGCDFDGVVARLRVAGWIGPRAGTGFCILVENEAARRQDQRGYQRGQSPF